MSQQYQHKYLRTPWNSGNFLFNYLYPKTEKCSFLFAMNVSLQTFAKIFKCKAKI